MLDYQIKDKDTGINDTDSVQPYDNSEDADQTILRRAPENLRTRTEVARKAVDEMKAIAGLDRSMTIVATPEATIQWGGAVDVDLGAGVGTGIPTLVAPAGAGSGAVQGIAVQSLLSNAKRLDAGGNFVIGDTAIMPKLIRTSGPADLTFESLKRPWENGNNIFMHVYDSGAPQVPVAIVSVEGTLDGSGNPSGPVTIHVSLSNDGGIEATCKNVVDQVNAHGTANTLVSASTTVPSEPEIAFEIKDATDPLKGVSLEGGVDSESFAILRSTWNAFFAGDDLLREGDVLVFTFPDAEARRKQGGSPESTLRVIRKSENIDNANVVPICKVIQDGLIFMNGTGLVRGETVRLIPDQHLRGDMAVDTGATPGDKLVGADAKNSGGANLVQGTVYSQVDDLLGQHGTLEGEYDNHVLGSADQHAIKDITDRPTIVVDASGGGDHATIQDALDTITTSGGTIIVKDNGSGFTENLTIPAVQKPLVIIGTGGLVQINPTAPNPAFTFTGATVDGRVVFENFKLNDSQPAIPHYIAFAGPTGTQNWITFRKCVLGRSAALAHHIFNLDQDVSIRLDRCILDGYAVEASAGVPTDPFVKVLTGTQPRVEILNCYIKNCSQLISYDTHGGDDLGALRIEGCRFVQCGYTNSTGGTPSIALISQDNVSTDSLSSCHIANNVWEDTGLTDERCGGFCIVNGSGDITDNILRQGFNYIPIGVATALIYSAGIDVVGNTLNSGYGAAIKALAAVISRNHIPDFDGRTGDSAIDLSGTGMISDNTISCCFASTTATEIIKASGANISVHGNVLLDVPDTVGILLNNTMSQADGNTVRFHATSGTGIEVNDTLCNVLGNNIEYGALGIDITSNGNSSAVSGNVLGGTVEGIKVDAVYVTIIGNRVERTGSAKHGIQLTNNATGCTVSGNAIYGADTNTNSAGILVTGDFNAISGNMVFQCDLGIDIDGNSNTIGNNMVNGTQTFCCDISGHYNAVAGNRWRKAAGGTYHEINADNGVEYESGVGYSTKYNNPNDL